MTHQKVTRDVLDLKTRPINVADTPGIEIIGDCGGNFSIDGVPIGQVGECAGKFALLEATGNLNITGSGSFGAALDMNGNQINELADGILADDAITLGQADLRYLRLAGGTMVGALTLGGAESAPADAADRAYAQSVASSEAASAVSGYGGFASGQTIQNTTGSRSHNTTYTNTTGKVLYVSVAIQITSSGQVQLQINGVAATESDFDTIATNDWTWHAGIVPVGGTFRLQLLAGSILTQRWTEYRL